MAGRQMLIGTVFDLFPPSLQQTVSLDFDGTSEEMRNDSSKNYGFGNVFSWMAWVKTADVTVNARHYIMKLAQVADGNTNTLRIDFLQRTTRLEVAIDTVGFQKFYRWARTPTPTFQVGVWVQLLVTWNGATQDLVGYIDGALVTPSKVTDNNATVVSGDRTHVIGRNNAVSGSYWDGRMHSIAMWDVELDAAAATTIYNGGNAGAVNLAANSGSYTQSADLLHWWRLGFNASDIGEDSGFSSPLIDANFSGGGLTAADIVTDAPP